MTKQNKRYTIIDCKTHFIYKDNMTSMVHSIPKDVVGVVGGKSMLNGSPIKEAK